MPYNLVVESFHTKKLCSRLSSTKSPLFYGKWPLCVFAPALGEGLGAVYDVHLRLIGKLLVELNFFSLGAMAEPLREIVCWKLPFLKEMGQFGQKLQVEGEIPHQPFFVSEN